MPTADFDLIIFDCDGTLVDSEYLNCKAVVMILEEAGITGYSIERYMKEFTGMTLTNSLLKVQMETGFDIPQDIVPRYIQKVSELQKTELRAVRGALDIVKKSHDRFKICVGSNGERSNVMSSLSLSGFDPYFSDQNIFTRIQVPNGKPAPDLFSYAAEQMGGVDPSHCLVIEDSESGIAAGVAAGMNVWGFTGTAHDPDHAPARLKNAGAGEIFDDLIHIGQALGL